MLKILSKYLDGNERLLNQLTPLVDKINSLENAYEKLSNSQIKEKTEEFKKIIKTASDTEKALNELLPEAYALVREAAKRTLKQRHFNEQILAGIVLYQGKIAEQKTGEEKL